MSSSLDGPMAEAESMSTRSWHTSSSEGDTPGSLNSTKTLRRAGTHTSFEEAYLRPSLRNLQKDVSKPDLRSAVRKKLTIIMDSRIFHSLVVTIIGFNVVLIFAETNDRATCLRKQTDSDCTSMGPWPKINRAILGFYAVELVVRLYVSRCEFFSNVSNVIDALVVLLGCVDVLVMQEMVQGRQFPEVGFLRVFRLLRVVRFSRLLRVFPELLHMARGFFQAMAAMFWGFGLLVVMLMMFAVITVELAYPVAQAMADRGEDFIDCAERLSKVQTTMMLFFQTLVAGDSWGECSIPLIREEAWIFIIMGFALVCIQLGLMNLILSAIIESAYKHHAIDERTDRLRKFAEEKENVRRMLDIMAQMDTDKDGGISVAELETGYEEIHELRSLFHNMELDGKDLQFLFHMMDQNGDGICSYAEFIEMIRKSHDQDVKTQLMFVKLQLSNIAMRMEHNLTGELQNGLRSFKHDSSSRQSKHSSSSLQAEARRSNGLGGAEEEGGSPPRSPKDFCPDALAAAMSPRSDRPLGGDGRGETPIAERSRWSDRLCYADAEHRPALGRLPTRVEASSAGEIAPHPEAGYQDHGRPFFGITGVNLDPTTMPGRPMYPGGPAIPLGDGTGLERCPSSAPLGTVSV